MEAYYRAGSAKRGKQVQPKGKIADRQQGKQSGGEHIERIPRRVGDAEHADGREEIAAIRAMVRPSDVRRARAPIDDKGYQPQDNGQSPHQSS